MTSEPLKGFPCYRQQTPSPATQNQGSQAPSDDIHVTEKSAGRVKENCSRPSPLPDWVPAWPAPTHVDDL